MMMVIKNYMVVMVATTAIAISMTTTMRIMMKSPGFWLHSSFGQAARLGDLLKLGHP